jgi:hypothetical protein
MKHILLVLLMCIFLAATFAGCDKLQKATDAIDKAKTFNDDLQKKAKEIIPGSDKKESDSKKEVTGNQDREGKEDTEEKDD